MQDAALHKNSFSADHGLNPGWGVHEERPAIPEFKGTADIARIAMMFTLWSRIDDFLYQHVGVEPLETPKEEKKHRSVLLESETYLMALLCLLNNEHYSANGLVDAMVGVNATADQRGNARKRIINRTLPICGDHYGLFDYSERHMGNTMEYSICRSDRLVEFAETHLITGVQGIIGAAPSSVKPSSAKESETSTSRSRLSKKTKPAKAAVKKTSSKKKPVKSGEAK